MKVSSLLIINDGISLTVPKSNEIEILYKSVEQMSPGEIKEYALKLAINYGCKYSTFLDSDDTISENRIKELFKFIDLNEQCSFVHNLNTIDDKGKMITKNIFKFADILNFDFFLNKNISGFGNTIYYLPHILEAELIPFPKDIIALDWYIITILSSIKNIGVLNKSLTNYRQHMQNEIGIGYYNKEILTNIINIRNVHYKKLFLFYNSKSNFLKLELFKQVLIDWENKKETIEKNITNYLKILNNSRNLLLWNQLI